MLTESWTTLKYHEAQSRLWRTTKRFAAVPAGRGSGKTELAKRRLVRFLPVLKEWSDPKYFYAAPTERQAKRIAWQHFLALIPKKWISDINISEHIIRTVFGSSLHIVGLDKPQRIEGDQWDGGVIDESSDVRPKAFDLSILPALTWRNGWCWRIGVPKRQGIGAAEYKAFFDRGVEGDPDIESVTWPSEDIIPDEQLRMARDNLDAKDYREQFLACWETSGGGIFHAFDSDLNVRKCEYDSNAPLIIGSDFNVDPMCWVIAQEYSWGLEFIDELFLRDTNTQRALDVLFGRYEHHKGGFIFMGDATGRARKTSASRSDYLIIHNDERFKELGRKVKYFKANPLIVNRFASCNAMFCTAGGTRKVFIDPCCKYLKTDLESRYYKSDGREPADSGDLGHCTDAMGYVIHGLFPIKPVTSAERKVSYA